MITDKYLHILREIYNQAMNDISRVKQREKLALFNDNKAGTYKRL